MSRKILEGSYEAVLSLFSLENTRLSTHTHAFGTYYVIKHFTGTVLRCTSREIEKAWLAPRGYPPLTTGSAIAIYSKCVIRDHAITLFPVY